ncbi:MAG: sigma-54 dependent transcriptional regulator [Steroidobacteraceae bacterium]
MQLLPCDILIVDDDSEVLLAAELVLKGYFQNVVTSSDPKEINTLLSQRAFDVILLDMNFTVGATSGREGIDWLKTAQAIAPDTKVILMTAYGAIETAVNAMREGAADFVVKPWDNAKLVATVAMVSRLARADREVASLRRRQRSLNEHPVAEADQIVGDSDGLRQVLSSIAKVARTEANVLILGENGTGKELVAREIHRQSLRNSQSFVSVDLGAVSETLFESELFGHRRGAFTDAREDRAGRFEVARGGTLFLDEIGNLSLAMQAKLLGALESMTVTRVGTDRPIKIDARLICATNLSAADLRAASQFRQDLLYRINTIEIRVPALRERVDDIPAIAAHFARIYARKYGKPEPGFDAAATRKLKQYSWPGNVRELRHVVERLVIMSW